MFLSQGLCLRHTRPCLMGPIWKISLVPRGSMGEIPLAPAGKVLGKWGRQTFDKETIDGEGSGSYRRPAS